MPCSCLTVTGERITGTEDLSGSVDCDSVVSRRLLAGLLDVSRLLSPPLDAMKESISSL